MMLFSSMTSVGNSNYGPLFSNTQHQGLRLASVDSASFPYKTDNEFAPQAQSRKMEKKKGKEGVE